MRATSLGIAFLLVFSASARAQESCKLLRTAELESGLKEWSQGGKATAFRGEVQDAGGVRYDICRSDIVRKNGNLQIVVSVIKNLPMDGADGIRIRNAALAREKQRKTDGTQFAEKTIGKALCTRYGRPGVATHSVCAIPRGNGYVEVEVLAPTLEELPSMDAVAALVQEAGGRS